MALLVLIISSCSNNGADGDSPPVVPTESTYTINWYVAADSSTRTGLIENYWNSRQHYFNYGNRDDREFQYWPQAHALDVLVDAYIRTGDSIFEQYIDVWYEGIYQKNGNTFLNDFYDDMQWNALAMLRTYNITGKEKFKTSVDTIWEEIKTGWTDVADGGIMWAKHTPHSKNAISNSPASILASRLYQLNEKQEYMDWAKKTYQWVRNKLVNKENGAVWDHIEVSEDGEEDIAKDWIFTYNQGVFLGAALELYSITGESGYLDDAIKSADYTLNNMINDDGVFKERGTGDGGLFKGIFIRYLTQLIFEEELPDTTRERYAQFLEHNAEVLWNKGTNKKQVIFDPSWQKKPGNDEEIDLTVHLSGAMIIEAAALLERENILE